MAKTLSAVGLNQITRKDLKVRRTLLINTVDRTAYIKSATRSFDKAFGSASASITLHNPNGVFSAEGIYEINIGDVVSLTYEYEDDSLSYPCFYGVVNQRAIVKSAQTNEITLTCLDYIVMLQQWDIDILLEGEKVQIEGETLEPYLLDAPNDMYAQLFAFSNDALSIDPPPIIQIRDRLHTLDDPQYDGYEIYYHSGQIKFGFPLNVRDNYDVICTSYYFYTKGVYVEDCIEQILTQPNGYGGYLFNEPNAQAVIDNHLTDTFRNAIGVLPTTATPDLLTTNDSVTQIQLEATLTEDYFGAKNPIIQYKFNDNLATNVVIDSMSNYNATYFKTSVARNTSLDSTVGGVVRCFNFTGTDTYVNCGDIEELNDRRLCTFTFWIDNNLDNVEQTYFVKHNGDESSRLRLYTTVTDELIFEVRSLSISHTATIDNFSALVTNGVFAYFRIELDYAQTDPTEKIKIYINNIQAPLILTSTESGGIYHPLRLPNLRGFDFYIGDTVNSLQGKIDDFRLYDVHLPESYHDEMYNFGAGNEDIIAISYLLVDSTAGFPEAESAEVMHASINGDDFTYATLDATHFYGIPTTGDDSLSVHPTTSVVKLLTSKAAGQIWYLKFSNVITDLDTADFNLPSGVTVVKFDKRNGRIYLSEPIDVDYPLETTVNYSFKTLQASGIEINRIKFTQKDTENRYEAINALREFVAPNYVIRTQGDNKIWSSFLSQRPVADFDLNLTTSLNYLEDTDLYTRVLLYGVNKNPTNLMFDDDVQFVTTGEEYKGYASLSQLTFIGAGGGDPVIPEGADATYEQWIRDVIAQAPTSAYWFSTGIPNAGAITIEDVIPVVYIDGVAIDNIRHNMILQPVSYSKTTETGINWHWNGVNFWEWLSGDRSRWEPEPYTYYHYSINFAHRSLDPAVEIKFYNIWGVEVMTIPPNSHGAMNYSMGMYTVPGNSANATVESISTATYGVLYSTSNLIIDYGNAIFGIDKSLLEFPAQANVQATFEYVHTMQAIQGAEALIDGRWDTQVQTVFFAEPPPGYNWAILDFGSTKTIQAIDIVAGFYKPGSYLKFDVEMVISLHYSLDGESYYLISDKASNLKLSGGGSISLEEDALGQDFEARYIKIVVDGVRKLDYNQGVWPMALTEFAAYTDITLKSEAKLIPTTYLTAIPPVQAVGEDDGVVEVYSTAGFTEPDSADSNFAYIGVDEITYTSLDATHFYGVAGLLHPHIMNEAVVQYEETSTDIYDPDWLLPRLGDRLYKKENIQEGWMYLQDELDRIAKAYLKEFYKNHDKIQVEVMYSPHLLVGDTVRITDVVNGVDDNFFVEKVDDNGTLTYSLVLARYPE